MDNNRLYIEIFVEYNLFAIGASLCIEASPYVPCACIS